IEELKQQVKNELLLSFSNSNKLYFMKTDASNHTIDAILYQQEEKLQDY
ncbi:5342_t:CDS:1, partial [Cetraspora pellucida]